MNNAEQEKKYLLGIAEEQHKKIDELKKTITTAVEAQKKLQSELTSKEEENDAIRGIMLYHSKELDLYKEELKRKTGGYFYDESNSFMYPMKTAEWWEPAYNSFEEGIVGEFGDSSSLAKRYGFGVFKK